MSSTKNAARSIPLNNMAKCLEAWTTWNNKGVAILSNVNIEQADSNATILSELADILTGMQQVLEAMHERFDKVSRDDSQFRLYQQCIHMFEQEFMVKESIQSIVREAGSMSKQQLVGSISLWKAEAYLDQDVIKQLH